MKMFKKFLSLLLILIPINAFALIEVDITRGNLNPLPLAVSPLSIDENSRKSFEKILKKENIGLEISIIVEFTSTMYSVGNWPIVLKKIRILLIWSKITQQIINKTEKVSA